MYKSITFLISQVLQSELPVGEEKLQKALQQGEVTCGVAEPEDKEVIEEEVAILQEEFDNYTESLQRTKSLLEEGIVKVNIVNCFKNNIELCLRCSLKLIKLINIGRNMLGNNLYHCIMGRSGSVLGL